VKVSRGCKDDLKSSMENVFSWMKIG
jgi:hypothetical protein